MCKKVTVYCVPVMISALFSLSLAEVKTGILKSVDCNAKMIVLNHNAFFPCKPYGIITLDDMALNADDPKECAIGVETYYDSHPHERVYAKEHLHVEQTYHFDSLDNGCILYANGTESYSEMLLRNGLALIEPNFNDREWNEKFQRALKGAERDKRGLHETDIKNLCIKKEK